MDMSCYRAGPQAGRRSLSYYTVLVGSLYMSMDVSSGHGRLSCWASGR